MERICVNFHHLITLHLIFLLIRSAASLTLQMGLLTVRGPPKSWDESKKHLSYIRRAGVLQFISTYNRVKDLRGDELLWGDEIEYGIFRLDEAERKIRLSLRGREVKRVIRIYMSLTSLYPPSYFAFECVPGHG